MEFFYGLHTRKESQGKVFRNASLFQAPDPRATRVFVDGNWPKIFHAYNALGIQVIPINLNASGYATAAGGIPETAYLPTSERREEQSRVEIPDDWELAGWVELRRLASSVSDHPIINKEQAIRAIQAEIERREQGV